MQRVKEKLKIKILLIISADTSKQEIINLIQNKLVDNVIVRPFNANQILDAVAKLCGIERVAEKPWYMYTKKQWFWYNFPYGKGNLFWKKIRGS